MKKITDCDFEKGIVFEVQTIGFSNVKSVIYFLEQDCFWHALRKKKAAVWGKLSIVQCAIGKNLIFTLANMDTGKVFALFSAGKIEEIKKHKTEAK